MPNKEFGKKSNYWDKRRLQRYTENEILSQQYINKIQSLYSKANKDIDEMLRSVYKNYAKDTGLDVQKLKELLTKSETKKTWKELQEKGLDKYVKDNYKSRITRLEQIKAQIYERAKEVYTEEEIKQTQLYEHVVNDSYYKTIYDVQKGTGLDFAFNKLDNNVVNNLLSTKWSGENYSSRIWTNTDILANEVSTIIGGALISGKGIELTSREIRDRFNVSKYYAERLVRTEMNFYDNQADAMAYEEMGIKEFVPVAVLDNRTSQYCADIDGKHFKYSEMEVGVNYPPFHPNCRCTTRGYLGKEAEKLLKRRARNPITGENEIIDNMNYNEWYNKNVSKYGQEQVEKSYKMTKNKNVDLNQYEKYKTYLGKDVRNIEKFKEIKYNDSNKWGNIKEYVKLSRKGEIPQELNFNKFNSNMNNINWEAVDFSPKRVDAHVEKHLSEFENITRNEYIANAKKLLNTKTNEDILGFTNENGFVFRYDKNKNEFATAKPSGVIETYYKPKKGLEYWEEQEKLYGNKKDM